MSTRSAYREDLAYIHDVGFGHFARGAAGVLTEALRQDGGGSGTIVELGCGSGISARLLCDAGYTVVGVDLSHALIEIARARVPEAHFRVESFVTAAIPECVAVTAIGEVLNYAFDEANSQTARARLLERIYRALAPGGVLLFDLAGPARAPAINRWPTFLQQDDWSVLVEAEADAAKRLLTRRITTYRKQGNLFRRDDETHQLQLVDATDILELLESTGFSAQTLEGYGEQRFPPGLFGFLARKTARGTLELDIGSGYNP